MAKQPRKPIITNDPKDPRIKAYGDSLKKYSTAKNAYKLETGLNYDFLLKGLKGRVAYTEKSVKLGDKKPTTPVVYKKAEPKVIKPVSKPKPEVKTAPVLRKDLKQANPQVRLYPQGMARAKSVDSLKKVGYVKLIGNAITRPGQTPQYGAASSDIIKKALKKK